MSTPTTEFDPDAPPPDSLRKTRRAVRRRARRRRVIVGGIVVAWLGLVTGSLIAARSDALAGLDRLEATRSEFTISGFESGTFEQDLADAES